MTDNQSIPLCVDLDGSLVKLDTFHQALFLLLRRDLASIFRIPGWICKGKAFVKDQVMQRVALDATVLPYNQAFLAWLRKEHAAGRKLVLATASNYRTANAVAEHLGIFDEILASNAETNLRYGRKLEAIRERFDRFGYAGNDTADTPVWKEADEIILVNPTPSVRTMWTAKADHVFEERRPVLRMLIKAMRCEQWLKNILVYAPMFLAHRFTDRACYVDTTLGFFAFSFAASSIYVLNDLFDLSADQHHPRKCRRPIASGDLPIFTGILLIPLLVGLSILFCLLLPLAFGLALFSYYVLTTLYSWRLKQIAVADVLTLAILFSMRIIAGAAASGTVASDWFIEFAIFVFLSLALVKRFSELREMEEGSELKPEQRERGYKTDDLPVLLAFGTASGYIAVLVFTMYLLSERVVQLYSRPQILWLLCPLLLYWITRIWHLASRGKMQDDPLAFATKDPQTLLAALFGAAIMLYAI